MQLVSQCIWSARLEKPDKASHCSFLQLTELVVKFQRITVFREIRAFWCTDVPAWRRLLD